MVVYGALIIPILATIFLLKFFRDKLAWWEIAGITLFTALVIFIFKLIAISGITSDTDYVSYNGYRIEYYEYYSTWVEKTCSKQVCEGSGKDEKCHTEYYDCSYCDENGPEWYLVDSRGRKTSISESKYQEIKKLWGTPEVFVELNRDINYDGSCGKDGDKYQVEWNGNKYTTQLVTNDYSYTNPIKGSHSSFKFRDFEPEEVKKLGLYEYPQIGECSYQPSILGLEKVVGLTDARKDSIIRLFDCVNGLNGKEAGVKYFLIITRDKPINWAFQQESYWEGGNDNEVVICMDINHYNELNWVKCFSWCKDKMINVELREDLMEMKTLNFELAAGHIQKSIKTYLKKRDFSEFDYLSVEIPTWCIVVTYILTIICTGGVSYWAVTNEFDSEFSENKSKNIW